MTTEAAISGKDRSKQAIRITNISIASGVVLILLKFILGYLGHSSALIADAIHSVSDLFSDFALIVAFVIVRRPIDDDHNYGHGKFETLSTVMVGLFLLFAAGMIAYENFAEIQLFWRGEQHLPPGEIALWGAAASIIIKEYLFVITLKKAKKLNSEALRANAWHHQSDAMSSVTTFAGIAGAILLGGKWWVLDPVAAIIVGVFVVFVAFRILKESIDVLTEKSLGEETHDKIIMLTSKVNGLTEPHEIRTRKIGNEVAIEFHVKVAPHMTVKNAHDLILQLEDLLYREFGGDSIITIHVDPLGETTS